MDFGRIKNLPSELGFSLVELMVVVAIIGVLASVAVPGYKGYIKRAESVEVKAILSGIYGAEKTYYAQYNIYSGDLSAIGLEPVQLKHFGLIGFGAYDYIFESEEPGSNHLYSQTVGFTDSYLLVNMYHENLCMAGRGNFTACATRTTDHSDVWGAGQGLLTEFSINEKKELTEY